jgi:hypothetical protein
LAARRHEDAAAADYAIQATQAGEDSVRFNPSDLSAWGFWLKGLQQTANLQFERGEIARSVATLRASVALPHDKRAPATLGPLLTFRWLNLAWLEAQSGESAAATKSLEAFKRTFAEGVAQFTPDDPRRQLAAAVEKGRGSRLQLIAGDLQAAFSNASAALTQIEQVKIPEHDTNSTIMRNNMARGNLQVAALAALRLGHAAQAEELARRRIAMPVDPTSEEDAQEAAASDQSVLAHAIALQGRRDEARTALKPALDYYRHQQQADAHGTTFRHDFAYALYVSALARADDGEGRMQRDAELAEAAKLIDGASAEAKRLAYMREVAGLVAASRATPRG